MSPDMAVDGTRGHIESPWGPRPTYADPYRRLRLA